MSLTPSAWCQGSAVAPAQLPMLQPCDGSHPTRCAVMFRRRDPFLALSSLTLYNSSNFKEGKFPRALGTYELPGNATHNVVAQAGCLMSLSICLFLCRKKILSILEGGCIDYYVSTMALCWRSIVGNNFYPIIGEPVATLFGHMFYQLIMIPPLQLHCTLFIQ